MTEGPAGTAILRLARVEDAPAIHDLMKVSIAGLFPAFYDAAQTASSMRYIGEVDRMLIDDGTYFVIVEDGDLVACGGWSRRDKLYTGSGEGATDARRLDPATEPARVRAMFVRPDRTRRGLGTRILQACEAAARSDGFRTLALMATLPGMALYERHGFRVVETAEVRMPDGMPIAGRSMTKDIDPADAGCLIEFAGSRRSIPPGDAQRQQTCARVTFANVD